MTTRKPRNLEPSPNWHDSRKQTPQLSGNYKGGFEDKTMELVFNHCRFNASDVISVSVEFLRDGPFIGDGGRLFFLVTLRNKDCYQITPDSVVEPESNTDIYYRDKDTSWTAMCGMQQVIHDGYCRWYEPDETKIMAANMGYPIQDRFALIITEFMKGF
jgi:hypothetical protein